MVVPVGGAVGGLATPASPGIWSTILGGLANIGKALLFKSGMLAGIGSWAALIILAGGFYQITWNNLLGGSETCNQDCMSAGYDWGDCNPTIFGLTATCPSKAPSHVVSKCAVSSKCCCAGTLSGCTLPNGSQKECGDDGQGGSCGECDEGFTCNETSFTCVAQDNATMCDLNCSEWQNVSCGGDGCENVEMLFSRNCSPEYLSMCNQTKCEASTYCENQVNNNSNNTNPINPECTDIGKSECKGFDLYQCVDQGDGQDGQPNGKWELLEEKSLTCAPDDGGFNSAKCSEKGGVWLSTAPIQEDWNLEENYCCGDDGDADLGKSYGDSMCVDDNGYKWITGAEKQRYLNNTLLFCSGDFYFCIDPKGYPVNARSPCSRDCDFFCNVQDNRWTADSEYHLLRKDLGDGEEIDTVKENLANEKACCPVNWCFDGENCIENQEKEACDDYVYNYSGNNFRCKVGSWNPAFSRIDWENKNIGYCPSISDCFVGCGNGDNNYQPEKYFDGEDNAPQCVSTSQYILDNSCSNGVWTSRTSLVATKLIQIASPLTADNYILYCDKYQDALNEYNYIVNGKSVYSFLGDNCEINGNTIPCVNNFCVMKALTTGQVMFGVSLNKPLSSSFGQLIGKNSCSGSSSDEWAYSSCSNNVLYNSKINTLIYSDKNILDPSTASGWDVFLNVLSHPIISLKNLIKEGSVYYVYTPGEAKLEIPLLDEMPKFDKLYVMKKASQSENGALEEDRWDNKLNETLNYMMIVYDTYSSKVCDTINDFSKGLNNTHTSCFYKNGNAYVTETSLTQSYLLNHWQDFTSKLKP